VGLLNEAALGSSRHLFDSRFYDLLSPDDVCLRDALNSALAALPTGARKTVGGRKLLALLQDMGHAYAV